MPTQLVEEVLLMIKKIFRKLAKYTFFKRECLLLEAPLMHSRKILAEGIELRLAREDTEFLPKVKEYFPGKYNLFKKRLDQNLYCFAIYFDRGKLGAFTWYATEDYYEPMYRYTFKLAPHQIYQFDGYLAPEFRKGMLAPRLMFYYAHNYFFRKGYTHTIVFVDKSNARNLKFHSFWRFRETGEKIVTYFIFRRPFTHSETYSERYLKVR